MRQYNRYNDRQTFEKDSSMTNTFESCQIIHRQNKPKTCDILNKLLKLVEVVPFIITTQVCSELVLFNCT